MSQIALKTPCCKRAVRPAPLLRYAVEQYQRTCPRCRRAYRVLITPLAEPLDGLHVHEAAWTSINPQTEKEG